MKVIEEFIGEIPLLLVSKESDMEKIIGTIIFFHGFESNKENHIEVYKKLAYEGFLVVGVDNKLHGKRRPSNFYEIFTWENPNVWDIFFTTVYETASDIPIIIDYLVEKLNISEEHIGVAGVSMGGYITYTAVTLEPRIKVATPIIGSPHYTEDLSTSPDKHIKSFENVFLLSQTATLDTTVPPHDAKKFHKALLQAFPLNASRYYYIEYPYSEHMLREEDWLSAIEEIVKWYKKYL